MRSLSSSEGVNFGLEPDWLTRDLLPLLFAALVGCGISLVYLALRRWRADAIRIAGAVVVLTTVICLITRVVDDLATAFIVVGALSLVRLRAAIEDTRDFGFLLLAVAVGLGAGERRYIEVILGAGLTCALALILVPTGKPATECRLSCKFPAALLDRVRGIIETATTNPRFRVRQQEADQVELRATFTALPSIGTILMDDLRALPEIADLTFETKPLEQGDD